MTHRSISTFSMKDFYFILKTDINCNPAEITEAYDFALKKIYPDLNKNKQDFEIHFREIEEAYQVLSDPLKRSQYDQELKSTQVLLPSDKNKNQRQYSKTRIIDLVFTLILISFTLIFGRYVLTSINKTKVAKIKKAFIATPYFSYKTKHHKKKYTAKIKTIAGIQKVNSTNFVKTTLPTKQVAAVINTNANSDRIITQIPKVDDSIQKNETVNAVKSSTNTVNYLYVTAIRSNETGVTNMRESGSFGSDIIKTIPSNSQVYVLEKGNPYYKVQFGNYTGYVPRWTLLVK